MEKLFSLGTRLRSLRKERNLTQRELASRAGISVNAVSLIERDEISPSVATLQSLARALDIKMGYFFDEDVQANVIHLETSQRPSIESNGITIESIGHRLPDQQLEPFFVTLKPQTGSGKHPVIHSGQEFVYCLQGTVEYEVDGTTYFLNAGDILLFEARLPHHWRNPTTEEVKALILLQTTDEHSESVRRHFPAHPSLPHIE
jgi:transcriptional regulator with XRE-family HTH domain